GTADPEKMIDWAERMDRRPRHKARIAGLGDVAREAARRSPARPREESWALGYRRARALRGLLGAPRFRSFRELALALGAGSHYELAEPINGVRAVRSDHDDGVYIHVRSHGKSPGAHSSHLFSFTRAVGDVVCFPEPARAAVNELHAAHRQAAGRAFAAEFLAPVEEIRSMAEDGRDMASIADEFRVSTVVIGRQIENADRIAAACAA
ncbi:MAG: ImmA/IrrE family metallo-endopeptidase, partial [Alphaproteobacteria bacterium]|nr:ImmA/IrrE family metallo-endopeptidase [Alphaproteobacteria bacterium]